MITYKSINFNPLIYITSFRAKYLFIIFLFVFAFSCKKDEQIITDSSAKLEFSESSILFDTVFTTVGSVTKQFKIYNRNNKTIRISSIKIANGVSSYFRMNVDGIPATSIHDIDIPKKDSLFIFVEVTVNPTNQNNPLIIRDSVIFEVNGNTQDVDLEAWGQDAYFHVPDKLLFNQIPYSVITCDDIWKNDKPHVIYGYAVVDSDCKLSMQVGTKVYMHNGAVLWVFDKGTLEIKGSYNNPVTFQGDRLEPDYAEMPGQWGKIWLSIGSKDNIIDWAVIKNGGIGVQADTLGASTNPTLRISNTIIKNMSAAALFGQGSYINAYNCVFANAGQYTAALTLGGSYSFRHCTFANYWNSGSRSTPLLLLNNWYKDNTGTIQNRGLDTAYFGNCIVYGNLTNEIGLDSINNPGVNFKYMFDHSLLRTDLNTSSSYHYDTIFTNLDPAFKDVSKNDYNIGINSGAKDKGNVAIGNTYPIDLNNLPRNIDTAPDLGAYEYK